MFESSKPVTSSNNIPELFSDNPDHYYQSQTAEPAYITIALPPFLRVKLTSYKVGVPTQQGQRKGGLASWLVFGSEDDKDYVLLDNRSDNQDLREPGVICTFDVTQPSEKYFRYIRLQNNGPTHIGQHRIIASAFDITGRLIIC